MVKTGIYKHFKGGMYKVICCATHSENLEPMVVYQALYGEHGVWVRPESMWHDTVIVEGKAVPRFAFVGEQTDIC